METGALSLRAMAPPLQADLARLADDARLFPQKIDLGRMALLFVHMEEGDYRAASFLDDRILSGSVRGFWAPLQQAAQALGVSPRLRPLHFIFHAGHVGSTLVSRLLDEIDGVLPVREPLTLRSLAEAHDAVGTAASLLSPQQFEGLTRLNVHLWARGFDTTQAVILKATSSAARMGPALMEVAAQARALYLYLKPEPYLAALLSGENTPTDLRGMGPERARRFEALTGAPPPPLHTLSLGGLAALTWASERLTQARLAANVGPRLLEMDFDALLAMRGARMANIARHFGLYPGPDYAARVSDSPMWGRYSKAIDHAYSPDLRAQVLAETRALHGASIADGLRLLDALGARHEALGKLLS